MEQKQGKHFQHSELFAYYPMDTSNISTRTNIDLGVHSHSLYEINIVTKGESTHDLNGLITHAKPGSVYLIPPETPHGFDREHPVDVILLLLGDAFIVRYEEELKTFPGYQAFFEIAPMLKNDSAQLSYLQLKPEQWEELKPLLDFALRQRGEGDHVITTAMSLAIIGLLCRYYRLQYSATLLPAPTYSLKAVVESLEYIHTHYADKITIDLLSNMTNTSRTSYLRYFRAICRCTPTEYITKYRIQKAKETILKTDLPIAQIAEACGFYDQAHFSKKFQLQVGESPLQFRKHSVK